MRRKPTTRDPLYRSREYLDLVGRVATNVRQLRQTRGWTQEEAATRCGQLSVYVLRQIESAQTNVTAVTLARLSAGFGVDVADFLAPAPTPTRRAPGRPAGIPRVSPSDLAPPPRRRNGEDGAQIVATSSPEATNPVTNEGATSSSVDASPASRVEALDHPEGIDNGATTTSAAQIGASTRLVATEFVVPTYPSARTQTFTLPELRDFIATVLAANPSGLTASELLHAARTAGQERLLANNLHYALHHLVRSGYVQRTGSRGSYLHQWLGSDPVGASEHRNPAT
ncbi:MAG: helix-turn-helix transcriptional regulator [Deltaproteobacteria bacterium]|nr:helix-turn-helix transcriptional regulator [Myxococcales bacterium]MDP3217640.1 helix-turn-helix transcriptional regulator [Deltaproteobacteria bacterium]